LKAFKQNKRREKCKNEKNRFQVFILLTCLSLPYAVSYGYFFSSLHLHISVICCCFWGGHPVWRH
jgi:hypothetical protein